MGDGGTDVVNNTARSHRSNPWAMLALMDLALSRFASPEGRSAQPYPPLIGMTDSPALPAPVRLVAPLRSPPPCLNLDTLSSDESAGPGDISAVPICISDASSSPVNPEEVLSDDDLPTDVRAENRRQVIRIRDVPPEVQVVNLSQDDQICDTRLAMWGAGPPPVVPGGDSQQTVHVVALPSEGQVSAIPPEVGAVDLTPVIRSVEVPAVGRMETIPPIASADSGRMSPPTVAFEDLSVSSVPMFPNCVWVDNSQDVPEEEPVFEVSPGFLMRPSGGAAVQMPGACFPLPRVLNAFSDPVLGDPVAFALVPGSDASPMTLPVYTMPSGLTFLPGQSSVQTVMASAVSSGLQHLKQTCKCKMGPGHFMWTSMIKDPKLGASIAKIRF